MSELTCTVYENNMHHWTWIKLAYDDPKCKIARVDESEAGLTGRLKFTFKDRYGMLFFFLKYSTHFGIVEENGT